MSYIFYIIFGVLPSIVWLFFYLRRDKHPEPNKMILKVFFLGALAAGAAVFLEMGFFEISQKIIPSKPLILSIVNIFLGVALVEEALKYSVVRLSVLKNKNFDEPLDAMLYMIIAALGFAAFENILILWFWQKPFFLLDTMSWSLIRFLGATFLHTLCSGLIGWFLAFSLFKGRKRFLLQGIGLSIAALLHGAYNFSIMSIEGGQRFIIPITILVVLAVFVSFGFKRLKKLKSICQLETERRG